MDRKSILIGVLGTLVVVLTCALVAVFGGAFYFLSVDSMPKLAVARFTPTAAPPEAIEPPVSTATPLSAAT